MKASQPPGLQSAAYWRHRAEEARAKADQMQDQDAKSTMLGIAHSYDLQALRAHAREAQAKAGADDD
jgi:hypothetical protein